ncbi:MAG TPA: hypothetical protein VGP93_08355, partial [Polyangiaceae bacterium]|nr:hypothetical protein [Polyangiaceae bacterium]
DVQKRSVERVLDGVGARPWGIARTASPERLFTANGPSNDLSIVDPVSGKIEQRIKLGGLPWGVVTGAAK